MMSSTARCGPRLPSESSSTTLCSWQLTTTSYFSIFLISSSTTSIHRSLGRPTLLLPSGFQFFRGEVQLICKYTITCRPEVEEQMMATTRPHVATTQKAPILTNILLVNEISTDPLQGSSQHISCSATSRMNYS
jgi:hypothetical protein